MLILQGKKIPKQTKKPKNLCSQYNIKVAPNSLKNSNYLYGRLQKL